MFSKVSSYVKLFWFINKYLTANQVILFLIIIKFFDGALISCSRETFLLRLGDRWPLHGLHGLVVWHSYYFLCLLCGAH